MPTRKTPFKYVSFSREVKRAYEIEALRRCLQGEPNNTVQRLMREALEAAPWVKQAPPYSGRER